MVASIGGGGADGLGVAETPMIRQSASYSRSSATCRRCVGLVIKIVDQDGGGCGLSRDAVRNLWTTCWCKPGPQAGTKRRDVKEWLRGKLAGGEPVPANDILNDDDGAEFGERLIRWAKKELGVASHAEGFGRDAVWFWTLTEGGEE